MPAEEDSATATTIHDGDENNNILIFGQQEDPERYPHMVLQGTCANLSALRGTDEQTRSTFFDERNTNQVALSSGSGPLLMQSSVPVSVTTITPNDDDDNDEESEGATPSSPIQGELFVTNTQVLFVANEVEKIKSDLAIGAACIVLHAMTEDPELAVYLQLSTDGDDAAPTEVTVTPRENEDCQKVFDALCRLISLHPVQVDDDEENDMFGGGGGWIGGGFGDDPLADYGEPNDGFVWAPPSSTTVAGTATTEERDAMLEHLDNLLVVRPELELAAEEEGQFDDADDDE